MPGSGTRPPQRTTTKRKKRRYYSFRLSIVLMFYIVCIAISFVIFAFRFDITSKKAVNETSDYQNVIVTDAEGYTVTDAEGNTVTQFEEVPEPSADGTSGNPLPESDRKPDSYLEDCVFIGDSITTGLSGYKLVSSQNVLASVGLRIDNITTEKVTNPRFEQPVMVVDALNEIKPKNIYILLGSNGVAWYNNDNMIIAYSDFIKSLRTQLPDSDIYIISITPVGTMKENIDTIENGKVLNSEIDSFNQRLIELADKEGVYYVDVNSALKDETGKLPNDVTSDGMHFNLDTYKKFMEYILTHTAK